MPVMFRSLVIVVAAGTLAGCSLPYYLQAIGGQLELLRKREPIDVVIADPERDADVGTTLGGVAGMREFAVSTLGLPDNDSYTTYVDLDRPYAVWKRRCRRGVFGGARAVVLSGRGLRELSGVLRP